MPESKRPVRVKWAGPNTPVVIVDRNDQRLYITKAELVAMVEEIQDFIDYYQSDFSSGRINNTDDEEL